MCDLSKRNSYVGLFRSLLCEVGYMLNAKHTKFIQTVAKIHDAGNRQFVISESLYMDLFYYRHQTMLSIFDRVLKFSQNAVDSSDKMALKILVLMCNQFIRKKENISIHDITKKDMIDSIPHKCMDWGNWFTYLNNN